MSISTPVGLLTAVLLVSGCATDKTAGSRADGAVEHAYEVGGVTKRVLNPAQGMTAARSRCHALGYAEATPFDGEKRHCQISNQSGCTRWLVTISYRCTGGKSITAGEPPQ